MKLLTPGADSRNEYDLANRVEHPRNVSLQEIRSSPGWAAGSAAWSRHIASKTLDALLAIQSIEPAQDSAVAAAKHLVSESDRKLAQFRAVLEAGADPALVAGWIKEEQSRRAAPEARLSRLPQHRPDPSRDDLARQLDSVAALVHLLGLADPPRKAG